MLILLTLAISSRTQVSVSDSAADTQVFGVAQQQVYSALYWLKDSTPPNSTYLSVSDPRFSYSSLIFGRVTLNGFLPYPSQALQVARQNGTEYVIVTRIVIGEGGLAASQLPWNNYPSSSNSNFTLVYANPDVRIFHLP